MGCSSSKGDTTETEGGPPEQTTSPTITDLTAEPESGIAKKIAGKLLLSAAKWAGGEGLGWALNAVGIDAFDGQKDPTPQLEEIKGMLN